MAISEHYVCSCGNWIPCGVEVEIGGKRYIRHDNILDEALAAYHNNYGDGRISKDDVFYYVYGVLHSPLYRARYQNNLRRELPRIPMAADFWAFSNNSWLAESVYGWVGWELTWMFMDRYGLGG